MCSFTIGQGHHHMMMLGSKGILTPTDAYELLRCEAALAILQTFEIR